MNHFYFCFWAHTWLCLGLCIQGSLLEGIGYHMGGVPRIKPRLIICEANALPVELFLQSSSLLIILASEPYLAVLSDYFWLCTEQALPPFQYNQAAEIITTSTPFLPHHLLQHPRRRYGEQNHPLWERILLHALGLQLDWGPHFLPFNSFHTSSCCRVINGMKSV